MRIRKALIPAVLVAGMAAVSLSACSTTTETVSTSAATEDTAEVDTNFDGMPKEVPYLPESVVTSVKVSGSNVTGNWTADAQTTSADAVKDAEQVLKNKSFTEAGTNKWENDKYVVKLSGSGSSVKYELDRK
ncbi:hypothetical protein [Leifsonia shinshuensis]|uniref:hypothetical protein n=1 Tax=Leifsonia shinshuensis TaxID=150026 RepID=UPI002866BB9E|nr:hypothetical protein [Leifsonia shinshuensis]MDR6971728.1 ABC-type Fe3+-hydroxamate transport system substrate-binding protein [Leifsonia shinshuensis]